MRTELPQNVIVVISVNSGAVLYGSCEPCRGSASLGRCSHVVTFHFNEIAFLQIQIKQSRFIFLSPCVNMGAFYGRLLLRILWMLSGQVLFLTFQPVSFRCLFPGFWLAPGKLPLVPPQCAWSSRYSPPSSVFWSYLVLKNDSITDFVVD